MPGVWCNGFTRAARGQSDVRASGTIRSSVNPTRPHAFPTVSATQNLI